ncbi:MAG: restriction endonuclease subunit S [Gammaproteobacteria bacterium]|nr:restriction endonuclease subunit S [Gammaproteobacteria bacterium]MBU1490109.1 restriction endonuclease subunit S [Gammaproteobacteria bacterium]MBU2066844.1 restriction endonuclease subunit S [Gammaproteobacteria bacterium]MBU2139540.1 restriction endonuclease subunit S [Gammaproteobacteria bacterium]MBU2216975.1 restriction endonuclease subunit S [Gammaproteobacteria bacterium]
MDIRPGYKQSEVGVIPEDWEADELGRFWGVKDCKHVTALFIANGYPLASIKEVQKRFVDLDDSKQTTLRFYNLLIEGGRKPRVGDLILSRNATVGEVAQVAEWHPPFAMGQDVCLLRKKTSRLSTDYLQSIFRSSIVVNQFLDLMVGSTFKRANVEQIRTLVVPMPPYEEQRAIAEALSDADGLIESLEQLLSKKRQLKQGAMQELLTGKKRLPGFSGEWHTKRLGDIAHIKTGSRNNQDKVEEGEFPFFVRSLTVERINSYSHDCEAILVPGEGNIGRIFHYISGRFDVHQRVYAITQFLPGISGQYVYFSMVDSFGNYAMQNSVKATVDSLRLPTFQSFEIFMPPTASEQTAIATVLSDMDADISALEAKLTKARAIKQGMMQELLTGNIRLIKRKPLSAERGL